MYSWKLEQLVDLFGSWEKWSARDVRHLAMLLVSNSVEDDPLYSLITGFSKIFTRQALLVQP